MGRRGFDGNVLVRGVGIEAEVFYHELSYGECGNLREGRWFMHVVCGGGM